MVANIHFHLHSRLVASLFPTLSRFSAVYFSQIGSGSTIYKHPLIMLFYPLDVTFSTKVWWTAGFPDFMFGGLKYSNVFIYLRTGTDVQMSSDIESSPGKEGVHMLTIEGLIAVFSLVLTAFGLGCAIGRNHNNTRE